MNWLKGEPFYIEGRTKHRLFRPLTMRHDLLQEANKWMEQGMLDMSVFDAKTFRLRLTLKGLLYELA